MGSQTLEILRQGFWASFTGGWFFDPHEDIFCNTFHMYLWLCLLLTPFVLHLTTTSTLFPLVFYPVVIFVVFSVIKFISYKLHILFDGEELLEDKASKKESKDVIAEAKEDESKEVEEMSKELERCDSKLDVECSPISISLKDETVDVIQRDHVELMHLDNVDVPEVDISFKSLYDRRETRNISTTDFVTPTMPQVYSPENACIVHLHHTKMDDNSSDQETATSSNNVLKKQEKEKDQLSYVNRLSSTHDDNYLIIANEPTVLDCSRSSEDDKQTIETDLSCVPLSIDVGLLESSSTDVSSWESNYSIFFPAIDSNVHQQGMIVDQNVNEVKSEGTLLTSKEDYVPKSVNNDKTVSLSALESQEGSTSQKNFIASGGARPKTTNASLSEIDNVLTKSSVSSIEESKPTESVSAHSLTTHVTQDNSFFRPSEDSSADLFNTSPNVRRIQRKGAFRSGSGSDNRAYVRYRNRANSGSPGTSLLKTEKIDVIDLASDSKHIANSHEDTSDGAVHCFQDESGQWYSYAFGGMDAVAQPFSSFMPERLSEMLSVETVPTRRDSLGTNQSQPDLEPGLNPEVDSDLRMILRGLPSRYRIGSDGFRQQHFSTQSARFEEPVPKKYYMLSLVGKFSVKVSFDRLALLALLDRNRSKTQAVISVFLATLVALLGYVLLSRSYFHDFWLFGLCFVIAKCQFSLLKSVQPDSASPVHGHNYTIVFSRSVYFCITALLIIAMDEAVLVKPKVINMYGLALCTESTLIFARDMLTAFLLGFPVLFLLGLLPQINTFAMHALEQLDMHVFGSTGMTSLLSSVYSILRSIVVVLLLTCFCYFPLKFTDQGKEKGQHIMFSVFTGLVVSLSYHLSRSTSSPETMTQAVWKFRCCKNETDGKCDENDIDDPLPEKLIRTVRMRLVHDLIVCIAVAFVVFAVHVSTVFTTLQPTLSYILFAFTGCVGIILHYVLPQLRKQLPWLLVASPVLKSYEYNLYECQEHSRVMWFEKLYVWLCLIEKNVLYPLVCMSTMTYHAGDISNKFGSLAGSFILTITSLKMLRSIFTNTPRQHLILIWTVLFFHYDYKGYSETYLIDYFVMSIFVDKMLELFLKFKFILTYTAPWQITWGSAFHAFAQPVSVPHCGMLFVQTIVSAFLSAPLNPFLGSAIFITSYMRPIKFWEKDYNTKRVDHSNTRLSSHIDSNPGADDNNLNSIFYEHLTRSLQHSLCGDLLLGRWGNFSSGDCFIMASDYLNALVHIIEVGNEYVTFQLRGLEFRGTYCQQREVEAITENMDYDKGCCCFNPGHLNNMLSLNTSFGQRWLAWEVTQSKYILEGYSVSDNTATTMFQMFDLRKIFITYYVTSIIFYCCRNKRLKNWLADDSLMVQLNELTDPSFVDLDTIFRAVTDKDYDVTAGGITRKSFCHSYFEWIVCCNKHLSPEEQIPANDVHTKLVTLCFALSLLGRRLLSTASNNQWNAALKSFLHGLHSLFKGDFRVTAAKDEWVFTDPDLALLRMVVAPGVRMALKLHQDHFTCVDEFGDNNVLYETISQHEQQFVICHEGHPEWRQAVLHNKPNLLALRYVLDDGTDDYKIIMLIKRCLNFRVIKVNKECVRGLWAGQLQELIFLRNRNPERGSIQNAKQALRNMINSSCDQPIGYPIYVSPLTTSYAETNPFYNTVSLGSINGTNIRNFFTRCYRSITNQYAGHCASSQSREIVIEMTYMPPEQSHLQSGKPASSRNSNKVTVQPKRMSSLRAGSYSSIPASSNSSNASTSASQTDKQTINFPYFPSEGKARLKNISCVTEALNSKIYSELQWTYVASLKDIASMAAWDGWYPSENLIGDIVFRWEPNHDDPDRRSFLDKNIYLLRFGNYIVPSYEGGIEILDESLQESLKEFLNSRL